MTSQSDGDLLGKYLEGSSDDVEMLGPSVLVSRSRRVMVNFVAAHGSELAIAFSLLLFAEFSPRGKDGDVIKLHFSTHTVKLMGLRMEKVFAAIREQRVASVVAVDPFRSNDTKGPLVTKIEQVPRSTASA